MPEADWISRYFVPIARSVAAAELSDDVASLSVEGASPMVATVDAMVEGIHFRPGDPLESVARKLVRVNVSDVYSAGAHPREALLTLGWSAGRPETDLEEFAAAFGDDLKAHDIDLIGGDTVTSPGGLFLSLTLTGACEGMAPVRRGGARPGQDVWVTGTIGAACLGHDALEKGNRGDPWAIFYLEPQLPPAGIAALVARHASAAMDVSDGLLGDAAKLARASGCGIRLELGDVPLAGGGGNLEQILRLTTWGDDYQILFTAEKSARDAIRGEAGDAAVDIGIIGETGSEQGLSALWQGAAVNLPETLGFEHE